MKEGSFDPGFRSNPPLPDIPQIVPDTRDGRVYNYVKYIPHPHRSVFDGIRYSAETMSLRAKLNLGVPLSKVSIGVLENDPNVLVHKALTFEKSIYAKLEELTMSSVSEEINEE